MSLFDRIGETKLRAVLVDFYDRLFADLMIGFMFHGKAKAHLVAREYEFAARMFGASTVQYTGRPLRAAHAAHQIFGGQFERRVQILRETLADHDVDQEVRDTWIEHTYSLRSQVTRDKGSECANPGPSLKLAPVPLDPDRPIKLGRK